MWNVKLILLSAELNQKNKFIGGTFYMRQGCIKFPVIWYSTPPPFLNFLIFFPKISVPLPSSPLDNLPYSLNIIEQILLPLAIFSKWNSPQRPLNSLPLFKTWNSSPKDLINWGNKTLYTPDFFYNQKEFRLKMFYFELKWLSSGYIFQVATSLQSSGGMLAENE